jgi:hypothetical protein
LKAKNIFGFDPIDIYKKIHGKALKTKAARVTMPSVRGRGRGRLGRNASDLSAS